MTRSPAWRKLGVEETFAMIDFPRKPVCDLKESCCQVTPDPCPCCTDPPPQPDSFTLAFSGLPAGCVCNELVAVALRALADKLAPPNEARP